MLVALFMRLIDFQPARRVSMERRYFYFEFVFVFVFDSSHFTLIPIELKLLNYIFFSTLFGE